MSISLAPVLAPPLFQDDFATDPSGPVSAAEWSEPTGGAEFIPPAGGSGYQGTETQPTPPDVEGGALQLELQTYNPTGNPQGQSFQGAAIYSNQSFIANTPGQGIAFTAVAELTSAIPGMVGGIFAYGVNGTTGLHDEIDFESRSDFAATTPNQEQTNIYANQPANSPGSPVLVNDPSLTSYQTYTMEWFPNEVLWFINGVLVNQNTVSVPRTAMQFYLNIWAYDAGTSLLPAPTMATNQIYTFDVQSASVSAIQDVNSTLLITGAVADQAATDSTSVAPFAGVTVSDVNPDPTDTVNVTLSSAGNGKITNLGTGSYNAATGVYTVNGTPAAVTSALDGLVFTPTPHQAPGETVATGFTISATDTAQASATDNVTSVLTVDAPPGVIGELSVSQQIELIYIAYFDRSADNPGLTYWVGQDTQAQQSGQSASLALTNIANSFAPQAETIALYPIFGLPNFDPTSPAAAAAINSFVGNVYENLFGRPADTAGLNYWDNQVTNGTVGLGAAALDIANGATGTDATELLNKIAVALDFTTRTGAASLGQAPLPASFVTAAKGVLSGGDGTSLYDASVTAGMNATTTYLASATTGHQTAVTSADPAIITVTGSDQLIDPGSGAHTIQFIAGASGDTLVVRAGGVDQVSGFDPATDRLDLGSLLTTANVDPGGNLAGVGNYLTIVDQGANALLNFDLTGHGGGSTVAVLLGLGNAITDLNTLVADGAIKVA